MRGRLLPLLGALLVAAGTAWAFWPAAGFGFLSFDDPVYVAENPAVTGGLSPAGVKRAFTTFQEGLWIPVTALSWMADASLFGAGPRGFHLGNILLHSLNAGILALVLWRMTGRAGPSLAGAALFALHPMRVESVAWVSERKDLLAAFFLLLALAAWLRFLRDRRAGWSLATAALFCLALLSKPVVVAFPLLLLTLDLWPLKRTADGLLPLVREKLPLLAPAAAAAAVSAWGHGGTAPPLEGAASLVPRLQMVLETPLHLLRSTFWPLGLHLVPGFAAPDPSWTRIALAAGALALVTLLALWAADRAPWLAFAWGWYAAAVLPVAGLLFSTFTPGDRFAYLPHMGLAAGAAWGADALLPRGRWRPAAGALLCLALLAGLAAATRRQLPYWRDDLPLWSRGAELLSAVDRSPRPGDGAFLPPGPAMSILLGSALLEAGRGGEAVEELKTAVRRGPDLAQPRAALARALDLLGRTGEAIGEMKAALALKAAPSERPGILLDLGRMLRRAGRREEAVAYLTSAADGDPGWAEAQIEAGAALTELGLAEEALPYLERAAR